MCVQITLKCSYIFQHVKYYDVTTTQAGCTTLRRLVFAVQGLIPRESVNWEKVSEEQYLVPAMKKATFLNKTLTHPQRLKRVKEYFKFMIVRNPLERLVSAYCDKIEHPITFSFSDNSSNIILSHQSLPKELDFFEAHRRWILSQYRHAQLERWAKSGGNFTLQPSFSDFVRWIVDSDDSRMNEHFASTIVNAQPCKIWYHFYANFKNYSREVRLLIHKLNIPPHYFVDHNSHAPGNETSTKLHHYYSQLTPHLKRDLFEHMFQELDFYYHLYPEEQWSHAELLGVTEPVLSPDLISS